MNMLSSFQNYGLRQIESVSFPFYLRCLLLMLVLNLFGNSVSAQELDPSLPPGGNFDLSYWKITRPNQQERDTEQLVNGYTVDGEFYTDPVTGAMVFWCPNNGATGGSTFPRNELREMIRRFDTSIPTKGINKNNWVFSSSTLENREAAGGVDGIMTATVAVDHVSETSDEERKIGRTIIGQIHASNDEPCRLYYRKLPGNTRGSIYFAHEPISSPEQWYEMIGTRSSNIADPEDGIALGEKFSYEIKAIGNLLTVTIMREGKPDVVQEVDMTNSGFQDDWMYFKAGNYNQNNAGDSGEFAEVSFFALDVSHFGATPPVAFEAPSDIPRFQPFLSGCKLQAPTSSTIADNNSLNSGYTHPVFFQVADGDKMLFNQSGESMRTELRHETNWNLNDQNRSLHGRMDIVEQTCDQFTVMQIHDDANAGSGPNKPLLRVYKQNSRVPTNHLWAAIKTDDGGIATTHVDLGEDPGGYFNCDVRLVDGNMIIDFEGEEKVNMDVSFWTWPSYWKAGAYLQDDGEATVYFDDLFEEDGSPQNFFPSVEVTAPLTGDNFLPGSDITITVDAIDSDGTVTAVQFIEGGNNILGEVSSAPYSFTWTNVPEGEYTLTAKATDNEGGSRSSLSTKITVQIPVGLTGVELVNLGPVAVGGTVQLEALITPATATNQNVVFDSEDASIASVSSDGLLTGISEGVVTINVTTNEGGLVDTKMIEILAPSTEFNWALYQPTLGSGTPDGGNVEGNIVDDNTVSRWSSQDFPKSVTVDLEGDIQITQTEVVCFEDRAYKYIVEGAMDEDGPYFTIVDRANNTISGFAELPIINSVDNQVARFVRITVLGAEVYTGTWASLTQFRVFGEGERTFTNTNLAWADNTPTNDTTSNVNELGLENVRLVPNPASSFVTIQGAEEYNSVSVYDQTGRRVIQRELNGIESLDINGLELGIYIVRLVGDDKSQVLKLIKQ